MLRRKLKKLAAYKEEAFDSSFVFLFRLPNIPPASTEMGSFRRVTRQRPFEFYRPADKSNLSEDREISATRRIGRGKYRAALFSFSPLCAIAVSHFVLASFFPEVAVRARKIRGSEQREELAGELDLHTSTGLDRVGSS